jgi:amino acid adenylation domain-containing protein
MLTIKDRLAKLTPEQRETLLNRLDKNKTTVSNAIQMVRRNSSQLPMSFAQQRLWFLEQLEGPSPNYNVPFGLRLKGRLHKDILLQCFNDMIKRHDILRTRFDIVNDEPSQIILDDMTMTMDTESISHDGIERVAVQEAHRPFSISTDTLLRIKLLELSAEDHLLLITMHHIISDAWSVGIMVKELTCSYNAYVNGEQPLLAPLPIQYADFSHWQRQQLSGPESEGLLNYWKKQLDGLPPLLEMPTDRPRPMVQSYNGDTCLFSIDKRTLDGLQALSQELGATSFMTLLSAFYILLAKYTKQNDIAVGTTIANRTRREVEELIGFFVNTLVLRATFSNYASFKEVLGHVKGMTLEAYEHQDLPFEQLVKLLQPERSLTYSPLFQVMFELYNAPIEKIALTDLDVTLINQELNVAKFDLTMSLQHTDNGMDGVLEFNTDLFDRSTIESFARHYQGLLKDIIQSPTKKVCDLRILDDNERNEILFAKNTSVADFPLDLCSYQLFSMQAKKTPERIAASCDGQIITYVELDKQSNRLAHYLIKHGASADKVIALFLDRSIDFLICMLGVLKSGAAFVPLDPYSKDKRTKDIVDQCAPILILSTKEYSSQAAQLIADSSKIIYLDDARVSDCLDVAPSIVHYTNSLAYVIFTSGSTGKPKGAMLEHRGMVNHLYDKITDLAITDQDVIGQIAVQTFDVAVWQFICALLVGARTAILRGDHAWNPSLLLKKVHEEGITILQSVPSHTKVILDEQENSGNPYDLHSLRTYIINGEPLTPEQCIRWFKYNEHVKIVNAYGATECSDDSHHLHIDKAPETTLPYMPVKEPLPNQQTYILDEMLEPVPVGVRGEIYFGGEGVGRGYLDDPERTTLSFVPNPFSSQSGDRLYRTGDIARFRHDGYIEFLGRADFQVKIRGFRIEIGEIEAVLTEHQKIETGVVLARKDERGTNHLIAYLIPKSYPAPSIAEIMRYCSAMLPDYMVPEGVIFMDEFPLSSNGKVDRKKLPAPLQHDTQVTNEFVQPRNALEEQIASVWSKVLNRKQIGIQDNFFQIGGHSLMAAELAIKLQNELNVKIDLRKLFEFPTIESFVSLLNNKKEQPFSQSEISTVRPHPEKDYYELAPCQVPEWYAYQVDRLSPVYNISFNDLFFKNLNREAFYKAWQVIFDRHCNFRICFDYKDGRPIQKLNPPLQLKDLYLDYTHIDPSQVDEVASKLAYEYSNNAFDFEKGPLFVLKVACYPDNQYQLLFVIHHIIWDETSTINLFTELAKVYNAYLSNEAYQLPKLALNYFDYVEWMNESIRTGALDKHKKYWLDVYQDLPPALNLPTDYPRPALQTYNGDSLSTWIPRPTIRKLLPFLEKNNVTLFMFMMSIIDLYFFRVTGQKDLVIGSPIAGRDHDDFKPLLGLFATPMPIRCKIDDTMTFIDLLNHVRDKCLEGYEHHYYPCNLVIEELDHIKDLSRPKLFSVMYGVQNNKTELYGQTEFDQTERFFKNLYGAEANSARFDLTLVVDQWGSDIAFNCIYNTDLFKHSTIQKMMEEMAHLVNEVLDQESLSLVQYNLLSVKDQIQLFETFNQTEATYPSLSISDTIVLQTQKTPQSIAIQFGDEQITYEALNHAVNRVANYLASQGITQGMPVGILLAPSPNMIIAILAVLKLAAHYVPISTEYPVNRIGYIIENAQITYLIVDQSSSTINSPLRTSAICLDKNKEDIAMCSNEFLSRDIHQDKIAYVIYTSGTTGQPKGIPICHGGVINLLTSTQNQYHLTGQDAILSLTPFTFDASILDLFWPLSFGAKIVIPQFEVNKNPKEIAATIVKKNITLFQCVPILLEALIDTQIKFHSLRIVICGGALLTRALRNRFYANFTCQLMNHYGPTEVTVDATRFDCANDFDGDIVPIGRPISNTKLFILDQYLNPVPNGVVGEIYIASPGLTPGYLNDIEKTKFAFIDKIMNHHHYRLYKSGDLGKFSDDGIVYYIGRIDKQVKVRGNRVELEEIDNALLQHPDIKRALTKYVESNLGEGRLISFVEFKDQYNRFAINNESYQLFTLSQRFTLSRVVNAAHAEAWPIYFEGSNVLKTHWTRLYSEYPEFQLVLMADNDKLAALGNTLPIYWDGTKDHLPTGWDEALVTGLESSAQHANTLLILAGIVTKEYQGKNLSAELLKAFKVLAKGHGLERVIVAVRPTGKVTHPEIDFATWCEKRRQDGQLEDNWLRTHEKLGGKMLKLALQSQLVEAKIADWEQWSGQRITSGGQINLPETLQPAHVDINKGMIRYYDPAVWIEHDLSAHDKTTWHPVDKNHLKQFLGELLPAYMLPEQFHFLASIPVLESGKINENALSAFTETIEKSMRIPPKTVLQKELSVLWKQILQIDTVGITDDFFELGGQSLKVIQLLAAVTDKYGHKIPLCTFYLSPTIKGLEAAIVAYQ